MNQSNLEGERGEKQDITRGEIRRPKVLIIDIICLGRHSALKPSQKHTVPKRKDKGPLSGRRV